MLPILSNKTSGGSSLKRSSSMIFRIEHLLPSSSSISSSSSSSNHIMATADTTKTSDDSKEVKRHLSEIGVFVGQFTPKGSLSECMATVSLMSNAKRPLEPEESIYCTLSEGVLNISPIILRQIKLSEDIHSYNALLELHKGQVRLRIVQDIHEGQQIVAWFCEQISILMSIPFLTLHNIQGDKRYTCHICQQNFETPHPLKLHIALSCDRNSIDILFIRLYYAVTFNQQQQILSNTMPAISMAMPMTMTMPMTTIESPSISLNYSTTATASSMAERYSAFRPIKSKIITTTLTTTTPTILPMEPMSSAMPIFTTSSMTTTPCSTEINTTYTTSSLLNTMAPRSISFMPQLSNAGLDLLHAPTTTSLNAAAQIEAIVSNMGASKGGHLCLYCGKCYSRKYGLKIHIRTHTGFKPLKCKFCLRPFGDPSNLNKHVRLHLQANAISMRTEVHKCHICNKSLARRRDLQRHLESRHAIQMKTSPPSTPH